MSIAPMAFVWYPRALSDLKDPTLLQKWFDALAAQNYYIWSYSEHFTLEEEKEIYQNHTLIPGVSAILRQEFAKYITDPDTHTFSCQILHLQESFNFGIVITEDLKVPFYSLSYEDLSFPPNAQLMYQLLQDVINATYYIWHPLYGFFDSIETAIPPEFSRDDIANGHIPGLYSINVFSPEIVRHMGRERLLTLPAWHSQEMEDGGIIFDVGPFGIRPVTDAKILRSAGDQLNLPMRF